MDSAGAALISRLESSSDSADLYPLFTAHLRLFSPYLTSAHPKPYDPQNGNSRLHRSSIRSLAKQFLPFVNRALSLLQKRLSRPPQSHSQCDLQLFDTYRLCLNCLECMSSQLDCKPHTMHAYRVWMIHCFEKWGRFDDAESEGFAVLQSLNCSAIIGDSDSTALNLRKHYLPCLPVGVDQELAFLVLEIVVTLVKCASVRPRKEAETYWRVLALVDDARPWFRVLDAKAYEKLHRLLVTYLHKSLTFLVGELHCFDRDLVLQFCAKTFEEFTMSSVKDEMLKFACRICSCLFPEKDSLHSDIIDVLECVFNSTAHECKARDTMVEFIEIAAYCANKCLSVNMNLSKAVAVHLNKMSIDFFQDVPPFGMILRLYASGLYLATCNIVARGSDSMCSGSLSKKSAVMILLKHEDILKEISAMIDALGSYFHVSSQEKSVPITTGNSGSTGPTHLPIEFDDKASKACSDKNGKEYMSCYLSALAFLCQPISEWVNSERKLIVAEDEEVSSPRLCIIQDVFHQFCDVFLIYHRCSSKSRKDGFDMSRTLLSVAVAAYTLSLRTKINMQRSVSFVRHIIKSEWIQLQGMKFLLASLYSIGITLYRCKQLEEASKAFSLFYTASWNCVSLLCKLIVNESKGFHSDLSEAAVVDFVNEACPKSAFVLDVIYQCGSCELKEIIVDSLKSWLVAGKLYKSLHSPLPLVKQWVKINCKLCKDTDVVGNTSTLYCLLSSSVEFSESLFGRILELELQAYEEVNRACPKFCQGMQLKIINILLNDVYIKNDTLLQKSKILIRKGRVLRAQGFEALKDCIQCLSEAISTINDLCGQASMGHVPVCHQLAVAYCLRALCEQESEPNSKQVFQDIQAAVDLWLRIDIPGDCSVEDRCDMASENTMLLLYHIVDLLSVKACIKFHDDIYKLFIRFFRWKHVPLEKLLSLLWEHRRLSHALCFSPLSDAFITNLSDHFGGVLNSMDFWLNCIKGSEPLRVGFQQSFSWLSTVVTQGSSQPSSFLSDVSINEVKKAALDLISNVPITSHSIFLASYLYHDMCEKLISSGRFIEALSYAKEAYHLRSKLLQEKFTYELQDKMYEEGSESIQKRSFGLCNLQISSSVATGVWSLESISWDSEGCILTPWNVLQCYLESTLQVGIIHEIIGNESSAEVLLLSGKNICHSQGLSFFVVSFSSILGKLYRKKRFFDLAEKELHSAKEILADNSAAISCSKCRLVLEATIDQQLGDLYRSRHDSMTGGSLFKSISLAENLYKSGLEKLNLFEWKNSVSCPEETSVESTILGKALAKEVDYVDKNAFSYSETKNMRKIISQDELPQAKRDTKKSRNSTKSSKAAELQEHCLVAEDNRRMTRSRYRSSQAHGTDNLAKQTNGVQVCALPNTLSGSEALPEIEKSGIDSEPGDACICMKRKCWYCLRQEVGNSGLVKKFINLKWEVIRRRISLRLLTSLGKCFGIRGEVHGMHEIYLKGITLLFSRNAFCNASSSVSLALLLDSIGRDIQGDLLLVERAALLYNICWFSLKHYNSKDARIKCCLLSDIQLQRMVSWLMLAFTFCREVPLLFQKISRLLVIIIVYSVSIEPSPMSLFSCNALSGVHWASYFHQASLGTHLNYQLFSSMTMKQKFQYPVDAEGLQVAGSSHIGTETNCILRHAPESFEDIEKFVVEFFQGLPCTTVICISLLGDAYSSLLRELMICPSSVNAWMLVSRIHSKCHPIVVLLPVDSILEEISDDDTTSTFKNKDFCKQWHCPWGSTVVDDVAPTYRLILEENYLTSSSVPEEDTKRSRSLWWNQRKELDQRLGKFLRDLENSWFGPWKYLLLGEWLDSKHLDVVNRRLVNDLKFKCRMDVNETVLKVLLGGDRSYIEEACVSKCFLKMGCYIGRVGVGETTAVSHNPSNGVKRLSEAALELILEAAVELEKEELPYREPVVLVLDCEVQMLPWENIPILRNQEIYRMPSIGSISATIDKYFQRQSELRVSAAFPLIDPLDAFYLLNPSGDLSSTQVEFENWFRNHNLEGKAGSEPTTEELAIALKSHDLFIYFGHGSGTQYIPGHEIQKLDNCAATLLMGCSSGSLSLNGCYPPRGTPLYYLGAGSPVIVANLWEVTDKDIDRFAKAMLDAWMKERSFLSMDSAQCDLVTKELKSMNINGNRKNSKKRILEKKELLDSCDNSRCKCSFDRRPKIGSFMGQARQACILPFLIGASPVCYGVPTGIWMKDS